MNKHSENFSYLLQFLNCRGENHSLQAKKKRENNFFVAHFLKSKTVMFGRELNDCRTKYRNVELSDCFFKLKRLFSYLINMARLLVFLKFQFFEVFSLKLERVLKLFLQLSKLLLIISSETQ